MLDGPSLDIGRFGWSFIIVDVNGERQDGGDDDRAGPVLRVLAAAYGTTPAWIRSMPAAEAWALLMATKVAAPSSPYVTDCLENVRTLHKGPTWAVAPSRPQARVWSMLMMVFDTEQDRQAVVWMPSHLGLCASDRRKSDGTLVTRLDIRANAMADALAKRGASLHRVPSHVRRIVTESRDAAWWIARAVGFATWAANNNGTQPRRDAEPDGGWKKSHQRQRRRRPAKAAVEARPMVLGGHRLVRTRSEWRCVTCGDKSTVWSRIAPKKCLGAAAARWADRARRLAEEAGAPDQGGSDGAGHVRFMSDSTTWCDRCGSYADAFAVGLARVCAGRPSCAGKEQHLRRLRRGRHPVTNIAFSSPPIPEPRPGARLRPEPPPPARLETWGSMGGSMDDVRGAVERLRAEAINERQRRGRRDPVPEAAPSAAQRLVQLRARLRQRSAAAADTDGGETREDERTTTMMSCDEMITVVSGGRTQGELESQCLLRSRPRERRIQSETEPRAGSHPRREQVPGGGDDADDIGAARAKRRRFCEGLVAAARADESNRRERAVGDDGSPCKRQRRGGRAGQYDAEADAERGRKRMREIPTDGATGDGADERGGRPHPAGRSCHGADSEVHYVQAAGGSEPSLGRDGPVNEALARVPSPRQQLLLRLRGGPPSAAPHASGAHTGHPPCRAPLSVALRAPAAAPRASASARALSVPLRSCDDDGVSPALSVPSTGVGIVALPEGGNGDSSSSTVRVRPLSPLSPPRVSRAGTPILAQSARCLRDAVATDDRGSET